MRFGDGAWRMLEDVNPTYLSRVDGWQQADRAVVFNVASRMEEERWATLAGHMFKVRLTTPAPNVVRVQVTHHQGRVKRRPEFALAAQPGPMNAQPLQGGLQLTTGGLRVEVSHKPWALNFVDAGSGESITQSPFKSMGLMDKRDQGLFLRDQLTLAVGEQIYGLGERFAAFTRAGQTVDMWNADCGTCSDKGYKDVPVFLSSKGYGVFVNDPGRVSFEIGTEQVMRAQFAVPGEELDYFFIYGPEPKAVLQRLSDLVGKPALPPVWSFGLWLTTSFTTDYDEQTVMGHIEGFRARQLPLHVFHFDCFWMKGHHWCNFRWDEDVFPDPPGMLQRLHARGLKICVWINSYIGERSHLFEEGCAKGYLLKRPGGDVYQRPKWQAGMGYVDFTNPQATRWYQDKLRALLRMGVDCFKTDFGEEIPTDVVYHDGSAPERMHQYYTYLYNKAVFELLTEERGEGEACLFARSATATCGQFPVHWGGDCYGTYESMAESLRGGLSLMVSGFGFWSHDIGGFESKASAQVYKRWVAFGLLSSHSRLHGSTSYRVPWLYDEEAVDVLRHFTHLKCRLMPYLMSVSVEAHQTGVPVMRPMFLEFPADPSCRVLDRQYMLGPHLLVAPVFHDQRAEFYLPHGSWVHLLTGEVREGGRWFDDVQDFFSVPVWVRADSAIAIGSEHEKVDYDFSARTRLLFGKFNGDGNSRIEIADTRGRQALSFSVERRGKHATITGPAGRSDFQVALPWADRVQQLEGGQLLSEPEGRGPVTNQGVTIQATSSRVTFAWD